MQSRLKRQDGALELLGNPLDLCDEGLGERLEAFSCL